MKAEGSYLNTDSQTESRMNAAMKRGNDIPQSKAHMNKISMPLQKNGNGPPSLNYATEPSDDENMNEIIGEKIDLQVVLPDGQTKEISIDPNIPMIDLLVNLAASSKLNPASFTLVLVSENRKKPIDFKANQTIGSLSTESDTDLTVHLVPKRTDSEKKGKPKKPFEVTYRFTVNLPRNQKKVLRISPNTTLEQVYLTVCEERHLDPSHYILEHPATGAPLVNLRATVGDLRINEVNFVSASVIDSTKSLPNLQSGISLRTEQHDTASAGRGGEKKKRGFFSFLRKDKKQRMYEPSVPVKEQGRRRPASMAAADFEHLPNQSSNIVDIRTRPKTMVISSNEIEQASNNITDDKTVKEIVLPSKAASTQEGKKRRAPPPPQKVPPINVIKVEVDIEQKPTNHKSDHRVNPANAQKTNEQTVHRLHSRNSSDSSGYHELTLSGPESPDAERIDENYEDFKTSSDTTSIDSEHLNCDSGIKDVSPPRRKVANDTTQYKSQTLPLDKTRSKPADYMSMTLDRADMQGRVAPSGKKKKAPPPPPGGPQVTPQTTTSISTPVSIPTRVPPPEGLSTFTNPQSARGFVEDEKTEKMLMEEDSSIAAEEIEINLPKALRPCSFVAPPPPNTPPPPDIIPVSYDEVVGQKTDTVDIGVGEDTTSLQSQKGSPASIHSTRSQTSMTSINTLEDLSMAFDLTIAVAEGVIMDLECSAEDNVSTVPKESASETDDEALGITHTADANINPISINNDDIDLDNEEEIPITTHHDGNESDYSYKHEQEMLETFNAIVDDETQNGIAEGKTFNTDPVLLRETDNIVSEIKYDYPVESLALESTEKENFRENKSEEYAEVLDEVIYPLASGSGSPRRIPDFDTPKEPSVVAHVPAYENTGELDLSLSREEEPLQFEPEIEEEVPEREEEVIVRQKEEFILTLDDLSNVDFGFPRKPKAKMCVNELQVDEECAEETHEYEEEEDKDFGHEEEYRPDVSVTPYKDYETEGNNGSICGVNGSVRGFKGSVKNRCTEISFSPKTESEMENVLEEKSISMIALPAMRVKKIDELPDYPTYSSSAKLVLSDGSEKNDSNHNFSSHSPTNIHGDYEARYIERSKPSSESEFTFDQNFVENGENNNEFQQSQLDEQQETLRVQYEQLQNQMSQWQAQLEENQELLESQTMDPVDRQIQLQQIQMYRDMMYQLQQNIEALNIQQQQLKEQQSAISPDKVTSSHVQYTDNTVTSHSVPVAPEVVQHTKTVPALSSSHPIPPPPEYSEKIQRNSSPTVMNNTLLFPKPYKAPQGMGKSKPVRKFEPKLDPREELMIAVRNYGGWSGLKRVPVRETKWHSNR
ncbi:hypothetical protein ScPMuIL_015126 [Solemya velum]